MHTTKIYKFIYLFLEDMNNWCLGVYVWQKLQKKNISNLVIIWINVLKGPLATLSALQHFGFF